MSRRLGTLLNKTIIENVWGTIICHITQINRKCRQSRRREVDKTGFRFTVIVTFAACDPHVSKHHGIIVRPPIAV